MNTKEIEDLLAGYFEGETTLEEEKQLRDFFRGEFVPPYLADYTEMFLAFDDAAKEEMPDPEFEQTFLRAIGEASVRPMYSRKNRLLFITSLAAGVLLLVGFFFAYKQVNHTTIPKNTITNPNLAYAETQKALLLLAGNFSTGITQVQKFQAFDKGMRQVQNLQIFDKGIQQVQKFSDFYKFQNLIINPDENNHP